MTKRNQRFLARDVTKLEMMIKIFIIFADPYSNSNTKA